MQGRVAKGIYILFDGTGNSFQGSDGSITNIKIIDSLIQRARANDVILDNLANYQTHYIPGIATSGDAGKDFYDSIHAFSLDEKLIDGYVYLMQHYLPGDKIYVFGFSRGAYTARVFVGWLRRSGLLKAFKSDVNPKERATEILLKHKAENHAQYNAMLNQRQNLERVAALPCHLIEDEGDFYGLEGRVEFVGLFDSVMGPKFSFAETEMKYDSFCHPSFVKRSCHIIAGVATIPFTPISYHEREDGGLNHCQSKESNDISPLNSHREYRADIGDHCDIGGGWICYPREKKSLSNHFLREMLSHLDSEAPDKLIYSKENDEEYPVDEVTHSITNLRDMKDFAERWILYRFMDNKQDFPINVTVDEITGEEVIMIDNDELIAMAHRLLHLKEKDSFTAASSTSTTQLTATTNSTTTTTIASKRRVQKRKIQETIETIEIKNDNDNEETASAIANNLLPPVPPHSSPSHHPSFSPSTSTSTSLIPPLLSQSQRRFIHPLDDLALLKQAIDYLKANFLLSLEPPL